MAKMKKYPMNDTILSAIYNMQAYMVAQNDYNEASKIQTRITKYADDMADLLRTDPETVTKPLEDYLEDTKRVLGGCAPTNPWYETLTKELNAIVAAQKYVQDAVKAVTQHRCYPMTVYIIEAIDAAYLRLLDEENLKKPTGLRGCQSIMVMI